jgi:hypothetical protein
MCGVMAEQAMLLRMPPRASDSNSTGIILQTPPPVYAVSHLRRLQDAGFVTQLSRLAQRVKREGDANAGVDKSVRILFMVMRL